MPVLSQFLNDDGHRRLLRRALPALAVAALLAGGLAGALRPTGAERAADRFARAWSDGRYADMYGLLTPAARRRVPLPAFERAYRDAAATATVTRLEPGRAHEDGDVAVVPVTARTRVFGVVRGQVRLPVDGDRVGWRPELSFPGVPPGAVLRRRSLVPPRAALLARDGRALAAGPAAQRRSPLGAVGASIAGRLAPAPTAAARASLFARGFPRDVPVGLSGLERIFDARLAGTPGGVLSAGRRTLAASRPRPAAPVHTTIDPGVQRASVAALGARFGGVAALDAATGEVRALAGIAFSGPQPPGSTFKIVTAAAVLEAGLARPSTRFPVETKAVIDGVDLENANGEACGGTLVDSFARSCNSVFAPLGVRLGARPLVSAARRFGFGDRPPIPGAARSTIPPPAQLRSPLELGATAIGQGRVLATPLLLAQVAQTVAAGGERREPSLVAGASHRSVRVIGEPTARTLERMMVAVVRSGTGTRASLPGAQVAGKTGTAELGPTAGRRRGHPPASDPTNTDAWFSGYAPVARPRLAVAVLLVRAGAGGDTAAPAAREVLRAGLR